MNTFQRFGYFGVGLFFGIVILLFFLSGKRASCHYGPNGRVLMNIQSKDREFSEESLLFFKEHAIDTSVVANILESGDVIFSKSITHGDPCNVYYIQERKKKDSILELEVVNCDSIATIKKVQLKKGE